VENVLTLDRLEIENKNEKDVNDLAVEMEAIDFDKCIIFSKKQNAVFVGKGACESDIINAANYIKNNVST